MGFKTLTSNDSALQEIWHDSGSVERQRHYKYWSSRINSTLHKCFQKAGLSLLTRYTQKNSGDIFLKRRKLRKSFLQLTVLVSLDAVLAPQDQKT